MDIKGLEQLISEIASQQNIDQSAIIDDVADILKMKYGISIMAKERELIDDVKMKVITKLYNSEMQKANAKTDIAKLFKLDLLEIDYFDTALDELEHEGLLKKKKSDLALTKEGVMKFKSFYGEI
jgi:uncharacterized protein YqgQ